MKYTFWEGGWLTMFGESKALRAPERRVLCSSAVGRIDVLIARFQAGTEL